MLNIISFLIVLVFDIAVLIILGNSNNYKVFNIMFYSSFLVFLIWIITIIVDIQNNINNQINDINSLKNNKKLKILLIREKINYTRQMKNILIDQYKKFEEELMNSLKDSKLIATILKESNYSEILLSYNSSIKDYLSRIRKCDKDILNAIQKIENRIYPSISNYYIFMPKKLKDKEEIYKEYIK